MRGKELWKMSEAREEQERLRRLSLPEAAKKLEVRWEEALQKCPDLPERMTANLVASILDVIACA